MKGFIKKYLPLIVLLAIIGGYLFVKALPETSWDGWGYGSSQTLMTVRHWVRDGWFKNYFLFIPNGYSKAAQYLDDPVLRHQAHGTMAGQRIGQRLYYTHYPPGYLIPFAMLGELGLEQRFWFRWLAILFSLGALVLFYKFIELLVGKTAAFWGVVYYALSTMFLDYADSLANHPQEDLLKYGILFVSILALKKERKYHWLLWLLYFALSISSYESTVFMFAWLVGLDILIRKEWAWKRWLFFISAPVFAFSLQIIQNTWYLGWHDMILDFYGAFRNRAMVNTISSSYASYSQALYVPFRRFLALNLQARIVIPIMIALAAGIAILLKKNRKFLENIPKVLALLYLASVSQLLVIFAIARWPYSGRQIAPLLGLSVGILMVIAGRYLVKIYHSLKQNNAETEGKLGTTAKQYLVPFAIVILMLVFLWSLEIKNTVKYLKQWPNNVTADIGIIDLSKKIKSQVPGDGVIFYLFNSTTDLGPPPKDTESLVLYNLARYPQIDKMSEYYLEKLVLGFINADDLIKDLSYLKSISQYPFSPIIITESDKTAQTLGKKLAEKNLSPIPIFVHTSGVRF